MNKLWLKPVTSIEDAIEAMDGEERLLKLVRSYLRMRYVTIQYSKWKHEMWEKGIKEPYKYNNREEINKLREKWNEEARTLIGE